MVEREGDGENFSFGKLGKSNTPLQNIVEEWILGGGMLGMFDGLFL